VVSLAASCNTSGRSEAIVVFKQAAELSATLQRRNHNMAALSAVSQTTALYGRWIVAGKG
jgi:hypothetical protein